MASLPHRIADSSATSAAAETNEVKLEVVIRSLEGRKGVRSDSRFLLILVPIHSSIVGRNGPAHPLAQNRPPSGFALIPICRAAIPLVERCAGAGRFLARGQAF